jgi:hypothetical protein
MDKQNTQSRSELWEQIFSIVSLIPRANVNGDAVDHASATSALEKLFLSKERKPISEDIQDETLINAYNATSTDDGKGEIETQTAWLERQLLNRVRPMGDVEIEELINNNLDSEPLTFDEEIGYRLGFKDATKELGL